MSIKQLREKLGVQTDFQIQYMHSDDHVIVGFGRQIDNLTMRVDQVDEMIKVLGEVRDALIKHQQGKKNG